MIPVLAKETSEQVNVGDTWSCLSITGEARDTGDVELVHVDFNSNIATVRHNGQVVKGPLMIRTDHPEYMGEEVAVLFV
jgi:hypothetical protein